MVDPPDEVATHQRLDFRSAVVAGLIGFAGSIVGGVATYLGQSLDVNAEAETRREERRHAVYGQFLAEATEAQRTLDDVGDVVQDVPEDVLRPVAASRYAVVLLGSDEAGDIAREILGRLRTYALTVAGESDLPRSRARDNVTASIDEFVEVAREDLGLDPEDE